jgi:hypothetical protein
LDQRPVKRERRAIAGFSFQGNPSVRPAVIHSLASCEWSTPDGRSTAQVERLRLLLRQHGIEPHDSAARSA